LQLSLPEQKAIVAGYSNLDEFRSSGVRIAGEKYFTLSADPRTVQAKKGADGAIIVKTKQAVLVAVYAAPTQAPEASPIVESLADYLISVNY
jgi:profilin